MNDDNAPQEILRYDILKLIIALALLGITGLLLLQASGGQAAALLPLLL